MRLAFLDCQSAFEVLPRVIAVMANELGWDKRRQETEKAEAVDYLKTMGLDIVTPHQSLLAGKTFSSTGASLRLWTQTATGRFRPRISRH